MFTITNNTDTVRQIDKLIQTSNKSFLDIDKFISELHKILGTAEEDLLSRDITLENRKFFLSTFWRFLSLNSSLTERNPIFRQRFLSLLEATAPEIFKIKKIDSKIDNKQKLEYLLHEPTKIDENFTSILNSINDLSNLSGFWHNFRKALAHPIHKILYSPFVISEDSVNPKLSELFNQLTNYASADNQKRKVEYEKSKRLIIDLRRLVEKLNTHYSENVIFIPLLNKIEYLISSDFLDSPHSQPASLSIRASEKKYPLSQLRKKIFFEFFILNEGPGTAYDVNIDFKLPNYINLKKTADYYGSLEQKEYKFTIEAEIINKTSQIELEGSLSWKNFDEKQNKYIFSLKFAAQNSDIDWTSAAKKTPYTLEPIAKRNELIGREELLNELNSNARSENPSSYFISGQKRVGKTSIVKTFDTIMNNLKEKNIFSLFLDGGDFAAPKVDDIIANLGNRLCDEIKSEKRFKLLPTPTFKDALSPIQTFLSQVVTIEPSVKFIFIIDEFDEFPLDLYRGDTADAFFQTIRSISGKNNFAFVLVGGEKIDVIKNYQGTKLNKFKIKSLNYFDKETQYSEFTRLIKRPLESINIEINEEAIAAIYNYTSGNPYFTKMVCIDLYQHICAKRDGYITEDDIEESVRKTLSTISSNSFHHFWQDGILDTQDQKEEIIDKRKKVLHALIELHLRGVPPKESTLISFLESDYRFTAQEASIYIKDFIRRQVLILNQNDHVVCKVWLFEKWLREKGMQEIESNFSESLIRVQKFVHHEYHVKSSEITNLISSWGSYNGIRINEENLRTWLQQFGDVKNQRVMFSLLKQLKFYSADTIRIKMKEAYGIIERSIQKKIRYFEPNFNSDINSHILVSYLDKIGKSGAYYAKLFADENHIHHESVIEKNLIQNRIMKNSNIKSLVFIDDFIGTGFSAMEFLSDLLHDEVLTSYLKEKDIDINFVSVSGFSQGKEYIKNNVKFGIKLDINICDPLSESDRIFSESSNYFESNSDKSIAYELSLKHGKQLEDQHPLGYKDSQAFVVFENSCPNNTLTVLWKEKKDWYPLFKRN